MALDLKTHAKSTAAFATLVAATIGNAFSQETEPQNGSPGEPPAATAPLDPSAENPEASRDHLRQIDEILRQHGTKTGSELKENFFPRAAGATRDLLTVTLGDFNPRDFDTKVIRSMSADADGALTVTYRLTSVPVMMFAARVINLAG